MDSNFNMPEAKRKTRILAGVLKAFLEISEDLFVCDEQREMTTDYAISLMASADAEISYSEHTMFVAKEVYSGKVQ